MTDTTTDTKPSIANIAKALSAFQGEAISLPLDNHGGDIKYCDMHVLGDEIIPLLAKHNLSLFFFFEKFPGDSECPNRPVLKARLYHKSGEMFESSFNPPEFDSNKIEDINIYLLNMFSGLLGVIAIDHL